MPHYKARIWESDGSRAGLGEPLEFEYQAYVPDAVAGLTLDLPADLAEELSQASEGLRSLQGVAAATGLEALSRQLLRAESISSSHIEGLKLSQKRLAQAMLDPGAADALARLVMGNVKAMEAAIALGDAPQAVAVGDILKLHEALFRGTQDEAIAGRLRTEQNWIGGSSWSPRGAEFIPPPETDVEPLLNDLCTFMARQDLPALVQAALAHAQFETIHPFADGNGRVGRALIHVVLRRRGMAPHIVPPISLVLAANAERYIEELTAFREGRLLDWIRFFVRVTKEATEKAEMLGDRLKALQAHWLEKAGMPRQNSAARRLIMLLPGCPVVDLQAAVNLTNSSQEAVRVALNQLTDAGVLSTVVHGKKRNRIWEARELLTLVDNFEWTLARPTRSGQPRRASPSPRPVPGLETH